MIDAAVGASAHRVIAVTPWFGYSPPGQEVRAARADLRAPRRPHARGRRAPTACSRWTSTPARSRASSSKPVDHMTALFMLTQYFDDLGLEDLVVVSPDAGRVKLNKKFAAKIGAELAILDKERPAQQVAEIGYVIGDVKGKTAVIVDDMIDTAGTLKAAGADRARRGRRARLRRRHARRSSPATPTRTSPPSRLRADRRHRHDPAARRRARQHPRALAAPTC